MASLVDVKALGELLGKDYKPPLPHPIPQVLDEQCLCFLATTSELSPHLSLMRFTYCKSLREPGSEVLVLSGYQMQQHIARAVEVCAEPAACFTLFKEAHLTRAATCDLAVDTLSYNSHTTGSDGLWAGVPMLSVAGEPMAARVGGMAMASKRPIAAPASSKLTCRMTERRCGGVEAVSGMAIIVLLSV